MTAATGTSGASGMWGDCGRRSPCGQAQHATWRRFLAIDRTERFGQAAGLTGGTRSAIMRDFSVPLTLLVEDT